MSAQELRLEDVGVVARDERIEVPGARIERVYEPASVEEVARVVAAAARAGAGLLLSGGRTRLDLARPSSALRHALSLARLTGIDEFEPDEGVLHARAGTPIREIQETVEREGWELPLDPPGVDATVGGTIASAATGPRALAFGRVADAILGLEVVGGDGVPTKCGGRVVKNVTGYDLAKLHCGAFGSLGVITGAWLRLRPKPALREAWRAIGSGERERFEALRRDARLGSMRAAIWLEPGGDAPVEELVELGGSEAGVSHDRARLSEHRALERVPLERIDTLRDARARYAPGTLALRLRVLGSRCEALRAPLREAGLEAFSADPGLGVIHARRAGSGASADGPALDEDGPGLERVARIRSLAEAAGGLVTVESMPDSWRGRCDPFGEPADLAPIAAALGAGFDPAGVLNPGRFLAVPSRSAAS